MEPSWGPLGLVLWLCRAFWTPSRCLGGPWAVKRRGLQKFNGVAKFVNDFGVSGPSWEPPGACFGRLGPSWGRRGGLFGTLGPILGPFWTIWAVNRAVLRPSGAVWGRSWEVLGESCSQEAFREHDLLGCLGGLRGRLWGQVSLPGKHFGNMDGATTFPESFLGT